MNEILTFNNPAFGDIRTIEEDGLVLFCGNDVAKALGYAKPQNAISMHCRYALKRGIPHPQNKSKTIEMNFITEGDIYRLAAKSDLPGADKFESWIFDEVIPSIRKTGSYSRTGGDPETEKLSMQKKRADAMLLNAKTRLYNTIMKTIDDKRLSPIAAEVFGISALEEIIGKPINYRPPVEKTYTAGELAREFGVSANLIGRIANANGLKNEAYGITVMDKSPHSAKEIPSFRYNEAGRKRLEDLIKKS